MTLVPQQFFYENSDGALCCYGFNITLETEKALRLHLSLPLFLLFGSVFHRRLSYRQFVLRHPKYKTYTLYRHQEKLMIQITRKLWLSFSTALLFICTIKSELCNQRAVALRPHAVSFLCTYSWNVLSLGPFSA